ncbi:MAG TPA: histidine kinase, partial [Pseudomonas sp.]|nr:histidine kinase [Pseudomonas sp.]
MTWWRLERRFRRLLVSLSLLAVLGVLAIELLVWQWRTLEREQVQHDLIIRASDVRSTLETRLLDGIYLTRGLVFFLHSQKGMSDRQSIEGWLASMLAGATDIRNIGIAPDNRIALIYPLAGNEAALGLDYRKTPAQWPAV